MRYSVEMYSGAMIYIPSFVKIDTGIQKLVWCGGFTDPKKVQLSMCLIN
jgi:hypothetical protein